MSSSPRSTPSCASVRVPIRVYRRCAPSSASGPCSRRTSAPRSAKPGRFRRARQIVRVAGLDPVVSESAETRRRGKLSKQGSPELRWALVEAAHHACQRRSADHDLYLAGKLRSSGKHAALTAARKIARRAYHVLDELEQAA
jgi:transposase